MAQDLKKFKGVFEFKGMLSGVSMSEDKKRLTITVLDKDSQSSANLQIWNNSDARYYDLQNRNVVVVKDRVEETMREVESSGAGLPFGIDMTTPKGKTKYYKNNELIQALVTLKPNTFGVIVKGNISFNMYNDRVMKNFNITSIEICKQSVLKGQHALQVMFPICIGETQKKNLKFFDYSTKFTGMVRTKLDNGQYGYRALPITLDKKMFMGGQAVKLAEHNKLDLLEVINDKLMPIINVPLSQIEGYGLVMLTGRIQYGESERKATVDDLNQFDRALADMMGGDTLENKLKEIGIIKEYADNITLESFGLSNTLVEPIEESELNLISENKNASFSIGNNPMYDTIKAMETKKEAETKEEVEKPTLLEEPSTTTKVEVLEEIAEKEEVKQEEEFDDEFPF